MRSVVLDGVATPAMKVAARRLADRATVALAGVLDACARSPACAPRIPILPATLDAIRDRLGPKGRDVTLTDPRTGAAQSSASRSTT